MKKIKVFIVDDHQMLIDGIQSLLNDEERFIVIGTAFNGEEALKKINIEQPDVVLTDINMPVMNGIQLSKNIKVDYPSIKIIVLSMFDDHEMITDMLEAGVSGYILKNTGKEELARALDKVASGGTFYSEAVSSEMMRSIAEKRNENKEPVNLTPREIEIIKLIAKEYSNAQIAEELFISERTVETHRKNIFRKSQTKSVLGLVKFAAEKKII